MVYDNTTMTLCHDATDEAKARFEVMVARHKTSRLTKIFDAAVDIASAACMKFKPVILSHVSAETDSYSLSDEITIIQEHL